MQKGNNFPIALQGVRLVVTKAVRFTIRPDYFLRAPQFVQGDGREQVMLNLAAKRTEQVIGQRMMPQIASRHQLPAEEV